MKILFQKRGIKNFRKQEKDRKEEKKETEKEIGSVRKKSVLHNLENSKITVDISGGL